MNNQNYEEAQQLINKLFDTLKECNLSIEETKLFIEDYLEKNKHSKASEILVLESLALYENFKSKDVI